MLKLQSISKSFGGLHVLQDVNIEVPQGTIFGLIGPNGAGKTTVFNLITGLLEPTGGSLTFDGEALGEEIVILGQPVLKLRLSSDAPLANLAARLVDVHPDGTATRVCFGVLNLAHRNGNAGPQELEPGRPVDVELVLDACGYRFAPGHRIRLSLSSAYWPIIMPPPYDATLEIELDSVELKLPLLGDHRRIDMPEPADPDPLPRYETLEEGSSSRIVERDLEKGVTRYRVSEDTGLNRHPGNGLCSRDITEQVWSIAPGDPLSMTAEITSMCITAREGWETMTRSTMTFSCTETEWIVSERMEAFHDGLGVFDRERSARVPRDHM